ncbi:MAG: hypothetical protein IKU35_09030 [Bacteroidaceae bacterium]|nr:hypothetical protein [Bacteroidaceae bacterium]MBR5277261.1 hypothetical protein [Bacteroidaceae bacterium]MBR5891957.1 hypothetical protein [Bacteroidaceae bacterium]
MPYRRLPNTDQARIRTLRMAVDNCIQQGIYTNTLKHNTYARAKNVLEKFSRAVDAYKRCVTEQSSKRGNAKYEAAYKKARMYVMHFLQVFSMAVMRGEIPRAKRAYYGLSVEDDSVPTIILESAVLEWSKRIAEGERKRQAEGGIPIYNPTMGRVAVACDLFKEMYERQQQLGQNTAEALLAVATMRAECDGIILEVWQEIEEKFASLDAEEKIRKCSEYGIIYYTRRDREKKTINPNE